MAKDYSIVIDKARDNELNTAHISSSLDLYEAARTSFFIFQPEADTEQNKVLEKIAEKMKVFDPACTYDASKIQELLRLNVTKAPVPHFSVETLKYRRGNEEIKFAGVPTFEGGNITIDDIIGIDTKSILEAWLELAYNLEQRTGGRMYEYKKDCMLIEYTQDYRPIRTWKLEGCFVTGISEEDFDKTSDGGPRQLTAAISYDRAYMRRGLGGNSGSSADTEKISSKQANK